MVESFPSVIAGSCLSLQDLLRRSRCNHSLLSLSALFSCGTDSGKLAFGYSQQRPNVSFVAVKTQGQEERERVCPVRVHPGIVLLCRATEPLFVYS